MTEKFIAPVLEVGKNVIKACIKNGPKYAKRASAVLIATVFGMYLGSKYQQKLNKEFNKKHDAETAKRLTEECMRKIEEVKAQCEQQRIADRKEIERRINAILRQYGISPDAM